ncbi:molybdopterin-dependent oxidoreductase [Phytoactinopolyspora alkaliphila]|uniref:Molybdopterin-dependent oxidoreductase n=2 Tax=Phytoactinopolyspora alkaliphila TaxID=1783498 RepID=A0A6N9YMX3_9ACTN|nr:molybdopterin-dependent oxidoreductase [Phytoactinopolyspora alkaliphila]
MGRPGASPVSAAGDGFIDVVPTWMAEWAISWFGTNDKLVLGIGIAVVLAAAGAAVGLLTVRDRRTGLVAAAVLVGVAAFVVWSRPNLAGADLIPILVGGAVAVPALAWLAGRVADLREAETMSTEGGAGGVGYAARPLSSERDGTARRVFLSGAAGAVLLAVGAGAFGRWIGGRRAGVEASRDELTVDVEFAPADVPDGADLGVAGAEPWRTPNDVFYRIDTAFSAPLVHPDDWRLRVHGMVDTEIELTFDELIGMGLVDRWVTLACVSNLVGGSLIGNALWTGVPIADVLALAGPSPDADAVLSTSDDGWTCGTPLEALTDGRDSLLAVGMNSEPLPVEHGFPVRMVVPGLYGYVSATKWVVDIEVSRFDRFQAYWSTRGWSERGPVKVASRIEVPTSGGDVSAGAVAVAGTAWAQHRGIEAVEVRVDGGAWASADLGEVPTDDTWRQWVFEWNAAPGEHTLDVRATTGDGEIQTEDVAPPAPDGATGLHSITVTAR